MAYKEKYPSELLSDAVEAIGTLPGVGRRSALRLALHLLRQPQENVHHFTEAINRLRDEVRYCRECRMISDEDICSLCGRTGQHTHVRIGTACGCSKESFALLEQIRTIDRIRLKEKVGTLSGHKMEQINQALSISVGLDPTFF